MKSVHSSFIFEYSGEVTGLGTYRLLAARELGPKAEALGDVALDYREFVAIDPCHYYRPTVDYVLCDPAKATKALARIRRTTYEALVPLMMDGDLELSAHEQRAGVGPAALRYE
jgi:hypothetical protein